jgi:phosphopantothenoylcysteine decarboxylase/phosphopantothenate--cysteine ligase
VLHIDLARWADAVVVAPATANAVGKFANGIADDLLSTILISAACPVFLAPSMNVEMYRNGAVRRNLRFLEEQGVTVIQPDSGDLICGEEGEGRLPEPARIVRTVLDGPHKKIRDLEGKRILITAGPTVEHIDPARYITNRSSGKMGVALAEAAESRGAEVTLIHGPLGVDPPRGVKTIPVTTAEEMGAALHREFGETDVLIMAAAVADYRPEQVRREKLKSGMDSVEIRLVPNPDLLAGLSERKRNQILVGFAAETDHHVENARQKLLKKGLDLIVLNDVSRTDIGFESDDNEVTLLDRQGDKFFISKSDKRYVAHAILCQVVDLFPASSVLPAKVTSIGERKPKP